MAKKLLDSLLILFRVQWLIFNLGTRLFEVLGALAHHEFWSLDCWHDFVWFWIMCTRKQFAEPRFKIFLPGFIWFHQCCSHPHLRTKLLCYVDNVDVSCLTLRCFATSRRKVCPEGPVCVCVCENRYNKRSVVRLVILTFAGGPWAHGWHGPTKNHPWCRANVPALWFELLTKLFQFDQFCGINPPVWPVWSILLHQSSRWLRIFQASTSSTL